MQCAVSPDPARHRVESIIIDPNQLHTPRLLAKYGRTLGGCGQIVAKADARYWLEIPIAAQGEWSDGLRTIFH